MTQAVAVSSTTDHTWVNSDRILSEVMPSIFQSGLPVLAELVQNAYRSGSYRLNVAYDNEAETLSLEDDGCGVHSIDGLQVMLTVGDSGFEEQGEVKQTRPAGMGLYSLIANARHLTITSGFGSLTIDCERWIKEPSYRAGWLSCLDPSATCPQGLHIKATGCTIFSKRHRDRLYKENGLENYFLRLYARVMDLWFNGQPVPAYDPADYWRHCVSIEGTDVWFDPIDKKSFNDLLGDDLFRSKPGMIGWYHHLIHQSLFVVETFVDVLSGTPFRPKLPDRDAIVRDDALAAFTAVACEKMCDALLGLDWEVMGRKQRGHYYDLFSRIDPDRCSKELPYVLVVEVAEGTDDAIHEASTYNKVSSVVPRSDAAALRYIDMSLIEDCIAITRLVPGQPDEQVTVIEGFSSVQTLVNRLLYASEEPLYVAYDKDSCDDVCDDVVLSMPADGTVESPHHSVLCLSEVSLVARWPDGYTITADLSGSLFVEEGYSYFGIDEQAVLIGPNPAATLSDYWLCLIRESDSMSWDAVEEEVRIEVQRVAALINKSLLISEPLSVFRDHIGPIRAIESISFDHVRNKMTIVLDTTKNLGYHNLDIDSLKARIVGIGGTCEVVADRAHVTVRFS